MGQMVQAGGDLSEALNTRPISGGGENAHPFSNPQFRAVAMLMTNHSRFRPALVVGCHSPLAVNQCWTTIVSGSRIVHHAGGAYETFRYILSTPIPQTATPSDTPPYPANWGHRVRRHERTETRTALRMAEK